MEKIMHGYKVVTWYAGMACYAVEKDGQELYNGCSPAEIMERFGFDPNEREEEK